MKVLLVFVVACIVVASSEETKQPKDVKAVEAPENVKAVEARKDVNAVEAPQDAKAVEAREDVKAVEVPKDVKTKENAKAPEDVEIAEDVKDENVEVAQVSEGDEKDEETEVDVNNDAIDHDKNDHTQEGKKKDPRSRRRRRRRRRRRAYITRRRRRAYIRRRRRYYYRRPSYYYGYYYRDDKHGDEMNEETEVDVNNDPIIELENNDPDDIYEVPIDGEQDALPVPQMLGYGRRRGCKERRRRFLFGRRRCGPWYGNDAKKQDNGDQKKRED